MVMSDGALLIRPTLFALCNGALYKCDKNRFGKVDVMLGWLKRVISTFRGLEGQAAADDEPTVWLPEWTAFLLTKVAFYRVLSDEDKTLFNRRVILFLSTTAVYSGQFEVTDNDRLLVAASAIVPVWGFSKWHYFNLQTVYLPPAAFNINIEFGQPDSCITGMVGSGKMANNLCLAGRRYIRALRIVKISRTWVFMSLCI
ncbi:MAG: hypothetical protein ACI9Y1_000443 [Lentisphaeria bacterium]|jgi:hypothetical protein